MYTYVEKKKWEKKIGYAPRKSQLQAELKSGPLNGWTRNKKYPTLAKAYT